MLRVMEQRGWDLFVTANFRTVYYFSGALHNVDAPTLFALYADGRTLLIGAASEASEMSSVLPIETYSIERSIDEPVSDLARIFLGALHSAAARVLTVAAERSASSGLIEDAIRHRTGASEIADATSVILRLRKFKEPDELEEIRNSLRLCAAAYRAARPAVIPGASELDVYGAMYSAVMREAGTTVTFPGDFATGGRSVRGGGPPTRRVIEKYDLFPLDIFPAPALYFGDTCRTFAAGGATDEQLRAGEVVVAALKMAEQLVRPGVKARDVYGAAKEFLDSEPLTERSFWHHLGHGVGIHGHEAPRIIPGSEDIFEVGDVFTLEPGMYSNRLQGGIRLEDNYSLTESGLINLFDFPLGL